MKNVTTNFLLTLLFCIMIIQSLTINKQNKRIEALEREVCKQNVINDKICTALEHEVNVLESLVNRYNPHKEFWNKTNIWMNGFYIIGGTNNATKYQ